jgi:hypothetical protein
MATFLPIMTDLGQGFSSVPGGVDEEDVPDLGVTGRAFQARRDTMRRTDVGDADVDSAVAVAGDPSKTPADNRRARWSNDALLEPTTEGTLNMARAVCYGWMDERMMIAIDRVLIK